MFTGKAKLQDTAQSVAYAIHWFHGENSFKKRVMLVFFGRVYEDAGILHLFLALLRLSNFHQRTKRINFSSLLHRTYPQYI
jgi:hypothetical protein